MKRFVLGVVALSGWILGPACQAIVGIEDRSEAPPLDEAGTTDTTPPPTTTDSGGEADSGDGGSPCPDPASCVDPDAALLDCPTDCLPPAPAGWTGPSAVYDGPDGTKPADCTTPYAKKEIETSYQVMADPATCSCGTGVVSGRRCEAKVRLYSGSVACKLDTAGTTDGNVSSAACYQTKTTGAVYSVTGVTLVPGTCSFPNAQSNVPPKTLTKVELSCGLSQVDVCTGRSDCVAIPAGAQGFGHVCIHMDGDVPCPLKDYGQRFVAYKTLTDTRGCVACTATPAGGVCGSQYGTSGDLATCVSEIPPTTNTTNTCYTYPGPGTFLDLAAMGPSAATCTPAGGTPTGEAKLSDPVTYCCNH